MKICAMCGHKLLNSMIPFQIMLPGTKMKTIDSCGNCFLLTRMLDMLAAIKGIAGKDINSGEPGRPTH